MNDIKKIFNYKGYKIEVYYDEYPDNPRNWDNIGTMICSNSRYSFGDKQYEHNKSNSWKSWFAYYICENYPEINMELKNDSKLQDSILSDSNINLIWKWLDKNATIHALTIYDHSGVSINSYEFNSEEETHNLGWDSSYVGFIYILNSVAKKELFTNSKKKISNYITNEVKIYNTYLLGEIYEYYIKNKNGIEIDNCNGFYSDNFFENGLIDSYKETIYYIEKQIISKRIKYLKKYIKNKIPLIYRKLEKYE